MDVTITAGDGIVRSKQATLQALQTLTQAQITPDNWKLFAAQLDILDIPGKQDIVREWEEKFSSSPETRFAGLSGEGNPAGGASPSPTGEAGGRGIPGAVGMTEMR